MPTLSTAPDRDVQQPQGVVPEGLLVSERRLELPRGFPHMALNHARLPIPPLRRSGRKYRNPGTQPGWEGLRTTDPSPQFRVAHTYDCLSVSAVPVFDVPGVAGAGRVVLEPPDFVCPHRGSHEPSVERVHDGIVGEDSL